MTMRAHLIIFILALIAILITSCDSSCGPNSQAANYIRNLSKERLHTLYLDMEKYYADPNTPDEGWFAFQQNNLPECFRDLKVARIRPRETNIMVKGCFDEFMYLDFSGFGGTGPRIITLSYPTGPRSFGSEIIWTEPNMPNKSL